jgi:hypothetical protein
MPIAAAKMNFISVLLIAALLLAASPVAAQSVQQPRYTRPQMFLNRPGASARRGLISKRTSVRSIVVWAAPTSAWREIFCGLGLTHDESSLFCAVGRDRGHEYGLGADGQL